MIIVDICVGERRRKKEGEKPKEEEKKRIGEIRGANKARPARPRPPSFKKAE